MGTHEPVVEKLLSRPAESEEVERLEQEEPALPDTALRTRRNGAVAALESWSAMAATAATPAAAALSDDAINRLVHTLR